MYIVCTLDTERKSFSATKQGEISIGLAAPASLETCRTDDQK